MRIRFPSRARKYQVSTLIVTETIKVLIGYWLASWSGAGPERHSSFYNSGRSTCGPMK
jgi:hypothetical protein